MKENNLKSINDLLGEFSQQKKIKIPLREARIVNLWRPLMGEMIHSYTDKIYVKNEVLLI